MDTNETSLPKLSDEQEAAIEAILACETPIFVTGRAGTGKSVLLRHLRLRLEEGARSLVAAFTGLAAKNVEGVTLHSFVLNSRFEVSIPTSGEFRSESREKLAVLAALDYLIIDEVSMVRGDFIDRIDRALRYAKNSSEPFGGCKLVLFGDLLQLPPFVSFPRWENEVTTMWRQWLATYPKLEPEFFMAHVFSLTGIETIELKNIFRQKDPVFIEALNRIRVGSPTDDDVALINSNVVNFDDSTAATRLMGKRSAVRDFNNRMLNELDDGPSTVFDYEVMQESPNQDPDESYLERELPCPLRLRVKIGAKVMFVHNDPERRWVNGTIGFVTRFTQDAIEVEVEHHRYEVARNTWTLGRPYVDRVSGEIRVKNGVIVRQFPLTLAWGLTVHKAQGQTLEQITCDFSQPFFQPAQAYVALSRVTSLSGLQVVGYFRREMHIFPTPSSVSEFLELAEETIDVGQSNVFESYALQGFSQSDVETLLSIWYSEGGAFEDHTGFCHRARIEYLKIEYGLSAVDYLASLSQSDYLTSSSVVANVLARIAGAKKLKIQGASRSESWMKLDDSHALTEAERVILRYTVEYQ